MKRNNFKTVNISKLILLVLIVSFLLISGKVLLVALKDKTNNVNLTEFVKNRNTGKEIIKAERGTIYSGDGEALALTVKSYTVIAYLDEKRTNNEEHPNHVVNKEITAEKLEPILKISKEKILELLNKENLYQINLKRNISEIEKKEIEALKLPGIDFVSTSKRTYPMGSLAPYVIGFAQTDENGEIVGKMGIEAKKQKELEGKDGYKIYQKDPHGYTIPNSNPIIVKAEQGNDIYLTIDSRIQMFVQDAIASASKDNNMDWLTFSVMDAKTGAIIATGSNPTFNLNELNIESYLNPLTSYTYEPGSTMKVFSFLAAMEAGKYKGDETYKSGTIVVDDATIKDFNTKGWGTITYDSGFAYSSNVAATNLALKIGKDKLFDFYSNLGFGKKTGIDLPGEVKGDIDFTYKTEVATASFGQGITTTPIQNLQALTILTNDGVEIKPYIIEKIVNSETGKVSYQHERTELGKKISKENAEKMKELMYDVVHSGKTDAKFFKTESITTIGKTGTAQITGSNGKYEEGKLDYVRSFAGIFPYEDPKYIVYVSIKRYDGNYKQFANMVAKVIEEIAKYKNLSTKVEEINYSKIHTMDNFISKDVESLKENTKLMQLNPIIIGDGKYIKNQYPPKKTMFVTDQKIFLITNGNNYLLPNITGWNSSEIMTFCKMLNIKYTLNGTGKVTSFNYPEGTNLKEITKLEITLE